MKGQIVELFSWEGGGISIFWVQTTQGYYLLSH
jgi:hypothetical protein